VTSPAEALRRVEESVRHVFLGKTAVVRRALVGLLAEGHLLIEDVPGVGKTTLARALARSMDISFQRIQFTPDLLPSDVTGVSIYDATEKEFRFQPGPVFAHVVLADEINRTTPRTQSALLEAMSDRQVTVDGGTHPLPEPFFVLATQNPHEFEGTYALPESQLDRFLMRIRIGYLSPDDERDVMKSRGRGDPLESLEPVVSAEDVLGMQAAASEVRIDDALYDYVLAIVAETRASRDLDIGASPRAALHLARAARALAFLEEREYVIPDDVKRLAVPVLAHRLVGRTLAVDGPSDEREALVRRILDRVEVPV
jgi:MoxR-like ATPase